MSHVPGPSDVRLTPPRHAASDDQPDHALLDLADGTERGLAQLDAFDPADPASAQERRHPPEVVWVTAAPSFPGQPTPAPTASPTSSPTPTSSPSPTTSPAPDSGPLPNGGFDGDPATTEGSSADAPADTATDVSLARFIDAPSSQASQASQPRARALSQSDGRRPAAHVALSRDDTFADSLAGSPLSADGPLLFTATAALTPVTRDEIDRVLAPGGRVFVLGGVAAVSQAVEDELTASGYEVVRLQGGERVATSVAIADQVALLFPEQATVAVARGFSALENPTAAWADSVAAGGWAAKEGVPIVVTGTEALADDVAAYLDRVQPASRVLLGGTAALSEAVEQAVPNPRRIAEGERVGTAAQVAKQLLGFPSVGARRAIVFNAFVELGWTRGLAAAGLAAGRDAPVLIVGEEVPGFTAQLLTSSSGEPEVDLVVIGPESEVPTAVVAELDDLDGGG